MADAGRDANRITALLAKSNASEELIELIADSVTSRLLVNSTITGTIVTDGEITKKYLLADEDSASDPAYYGYIDKDGAWYILQITESAGTYRYKSGTTDYATNWNGRVGLTYDYYFNEF